MGGYSDEDNAFCQVAFVLGRTTTGPLRAARAGLDWCVRHRAVRRGAWSQRLDSIAGAGVREDRSVGVVAAVVKGKDTLLLKAYGKADVEGDVPATVDTVFPIGSDTKQFTAAAILQLRDQGKLSLDDDITKWLPDFETRGNKVTLRHLLGHTSGIVDLVEMPELRAMKLMRNPTVTRDDVYKVISRYPFVFPTGTMQTYSNSGFWLLGLIIEKASGMTYEEYVEKRIFEPLGMTRSMYCNNSENVPRRAYGHGLRNGIKPFVRVIPIVHTATYAAGAICSTAEDLITWLQALHGGKVLTPKSYVEMITPSRLDDGTPLRYSMGLFVGEDSHGLKFIGHDGGGFGFSSQTRWYPDARMAVVVLTNSEPDDSTVVADNLAAAVLRAAPGTAVHGRRVTARRHIQGSRAWQGDGHRGDADPAGSRVRPRRRGAGCAALGRGVDVPPESGASHLPPGARSEWSGDGTAVRQGRWPLHPEAAVGRAGLVPAMQGGVAARSALRVCKPL